MAEPERRLRGPADEPGLRSIAQLRMLHALATRLNALDDVEAIGEAITSELQKLIDYHNCRVYLLQEDGRTLWPVAFRGQLSEYASETLEELVTEVGEGFTGHAAATGATYYAADALHDDVGVQIEGTSEIDESILAVPMKVGDRVTGVIVLSNLGVDQFDDDDRLVLEVLASHAAVAYENAALLRKEREAAATASALLALSQTLTGARDVRTVLERVAAAVPGIVRCSLAATYLRDPRTGAFELIHQWGADPERAAAVEPIPAEIGAPLIASLDAPFTIPRDVAAQVPREFYLLDEPREVLVAPMRWEPDSFGALVVAAPGPEDAFSEPDRSLAEGIAHIASLALGSARRVSELERFHELVETLDAIFWEADPDTLAFTFLSARAVPLFGGTPPERWGDHVDPEDRPSASEALRAALAEPGKDLSLEYRVRGSEGVWVRDLVHVATDARGTPVVRGLIVDVTERKRAEQALRRSEQKYLEAFHREREAAQRLRTLDEMKNTFLEAVSHDLRTPLTSILGSAVTLEQTGLEVPREDALDLLRRIAANARKLERLLGDLLDLDRLQRGIVTPQRRLTDVGALVRDAVEAFEVPDGRTIEVDVAGDGLGARLDAAKVERIVENLLANAVRHTPPGSRVWVRASREGSVVLLAVEDEGPGVPDELKTAIFEPFRQGPGPAQVSPGVGVGLSLVARFAELHGGRAWVEDRPGGGASFRVLLPED
jgi:signal transduction histidine kinase/putative methionine-R-sulfoxide reductase with GAF domain